MKVIHGTWIPNTQSDYLNPGAFYLWIETSVSKTQKGKGKQQIHPYHLGSQDLRIFLSRELGIKDSETKIQQRISSKYFALPTINHKPLPSPELSRYLESEISEEFPEFQYWQINCYQTITEVKTNSYPSATAINIIKLLQDIHFLALYNAESLQLGSDLLFWYHYTQALKQVILKDQYIPAFKYRQSASVTKKNKKNPKQSASFTIYPTWLIVDEYYEANIDHYRQYMPQICTAGLNAPSKEIEFFDSETLLRHLSEYLLNDIVTHTPSTAGFDKKLANSMLSYCFSPDLDNPLTGKSHLEEYQQWLTWHQKIVRTQKQQNFNLCIQLHAAEPNNVDNWQIQFLIADKKDPSLKLALGNYWRMDAKTKKGVKKHYGKDFEANLLLNLGYAARMYPKLWQGMETTQPDSLRLTLTEAFAFLKESAWVLENAGFKIIVPAWYTPQGRRRAKLKLKTSSKGKSASKTETKGYFGLDSLVEYQYQLAIGDREVNTEEWQKLFNAKTPLVHFRGEWMELDRDKMQEFLEFWQAHGEEKPQMSMLEFLQRSAEAGDDWEVEHDEFLAEMMEKLKDKSQFEPIADIKELNGTLREYQKRGVSWLSYLEYLGINGCLADDMGLGKSIQVIARLIQEREIASQYKKIRPQVLPTLLVAPTSVVGNWLREIAKFAPQLKTRVHHGGDRLKDISKFKTYCLKQDVVITSFSLARKDAKLLESIEWQRIVLDEAQNIKNPKSAQTKAILKLTSKHKLALTGTPVENRLLDLWSIFNFLNPGYLGKQAQFRKSFEIPIQKDNNRVQSVILKKLVEPLILRRVKTDKSIISDLPDKVEDKLYTNLTKEQASLYEAVVKDVADKIENSEGIERKGLILSTLMKLKQICNHPAQFLQDGSDFSPTRSHKLSRLTEMVEEAISEGESILVFSQFTEICEGIDKHLKHSLHCNTYYLHGGTSRKKREKMIAEFQMPETEPSVFILSLKAGGVGITLTKANHVFHFDRWWNPAVENQATDRAFRIGQEKNVFVHKFVAIGTLEEKIDQMIEDKKKVADVVIGSDESWLTELDNKAFKDLIALNKSAILD